MRRFLFGWLSIIILTGCALLSTPTTPTPWQPPQTPTVEPTVQPTEVPTEESVVIPTGTPTSEEPTSAPSATRPDNIGPTNYPANVSPFTGLELEDPSILTSRRPLLIKISNSPEVVRPQSGLNSADIIFEHYAEGGVTRFTALFWSNDLDRIGPVRSFRLIDLQLAPAFDGVVIFSGASNGVIDTIRASEYYPYSVISPQFGYGEPYFRRIPREDLAFEHTLYTDTSQLWGLANEIGIRPEANFDRPGWVFNPVPPNNTYAASSLIINYARANAEWRYDPTLGQYLRWTQGVAHTDALTGDQVAFDNIVVIEAYHEELFLLPEKYNEDERSWFIDLIGSGNATLLRDGVAQEGRWVRELEDDMITFVDAEGNPLIMKPGRTFVQVISGLPGQYAQQPEQVIISP